MRTLELQVDRGDVGERIDRFVSTRIRSLSRTLVVELVALGFVAVDGEPARRASQRLLRPGRVTVTVPGTDAHEARVAEPRVLHLDDWLLAIDKPSGLPVSARLTRGGDDAVGAGRRILAARGLAPEGDAEAFLGTPHRLDRPTSGVLVLARTRDAARALTEAFASRRTRKSYLAWVGGSPPASSGAIDAPIHAPGDGEARIDPVLGRPARTRYRVARRAGARTLLVLGLLTGRTHQLRLHLAHVGCPIVGDELYGGEPAPRLLLHARRLVLPHPATGEPLVLRAPAPFD